YLGRLVRGPHATGEDEFHRQVVRDAGLQAQQSARGGGEAALHLGEAELGLARCDDEVTGENDLEAARECVAFDGRDEWLARRLLDDASEAASIEDRKSVV